MKKILSMLGVVAFFAGLLSCTSTDCHCTYYNETGEEISSYTDDYEEMQVSDCSSLSTIEYPGQDSIKGYICE